VAVFVTDARQWPKSVESPTKQEGTMRRLRFPKPLARSASRDCAPLDQQGLEGERSPVQTVQAVSEAGGPEDVRLGINTLKAVMEAMAAGR
jgi:hypothetical protein